MARSSDYAARARRAGIVGAGGGGFPMYVKLQTKAETAIANGAECEPLLHKDKQLMLERPDAVVRGLLAAAEAVGAKRAVIAVKEKYTDVVSAVTKAAAGSPVEIFTLGNFYPSGDEYVLIHEVTGGLIPTGGLPADAGCLVQNTETLANFADAVLDELPVRESWVTVTGAVAQPTTFRVPLGTPYRLLLDAAGGAKAADPVLLDGGAMMGKLVYDLDTPVTQTTAGLLVLDRTHDLIRRRELPQRSVERVGHSACDQCYYCTEFCPRFLLGHPIEPHKVMRSLGFAGNDRAYWSEWAAACCECNLCTLYACPEDLDPKNICTWAKDAVLKEGYQFPEPRAVTAHPLAESRKVPLPKLIRRLGLTAYDRPAPLARTQPEAPLLRLLLGAGRGKPAAPVVKKGEQVREGNLIADVPEADLGCPVHAPRDGVIREVNAEQIVIERQ